MCGQDSLGSVGNPKRRLVSAARRLGVEEPARQLWGMRSREGRRDRRDMRNLRRLLASTLGPEDSCVDIGAHDGAVLRHLVSYAPQGRHIAFEPLPELVVLLRRDFPGVDVRNAAVSDHAGEVTFHRVARRPTRSSLHPLGHDAAELEDLTVRTETLDAGLPTGFTPRVIKIDVEGAEEQVLRGAERTLGEHRPVVVFEHNRDSRHFGTSSTTIHDLLAQAGLQVFDIDGNGPYDAAALERRVDAGDLWTFIARP
jgi:FkbM family methyltransferase